jgi:hypothetical protein
MLPFYKALADISGNGRIVFDGTKSYGGPDVARLSPIESVRFRRGEKRSFLCKVSKSFQHPVHVEMGTSPVNMWKYRKDIKFSSKMSLCVRYLAFKEAFIYIYLLLTAIRPTPGGSVYEDHTFNKETSHLTKTAQYITRIFTVQYKYMSISRNVTFLNGRDKSSSKWVKSIRKIQGAVPKFRCLLC